jgi:hypothetical protein
MERAEIRVPSESYNKSALEIGKRL